MELGEKYKNISNSQKFRYVDVVISNYFFILTKLLLSTNVKKKLLRLPQWQVP